MANEKRLIDANAFGLFLLGKMGFNPASAEMVLQWMDEFKKKNTVDAVEVVRCKDCRKISPSVTPIKNAVWCREFRAYMPCDGFCSYGERREGE